ncbi:MAG: SPOR domain-containing protein [bacterium]
MGIERISDHRSARPFLQVSGWLGIVLLVLFTGFGCGGGDQQENWPQQTADQQTDPTTEMADPMAGEQAATAGDLPRQDSRDGTITLQPVENLSSDLAATSAGETVASPSATEPESQALEPDPSRSSAVSAAGEPTPLQRTGSGHYHLQVGSFRSMENAEVRLGRLASFGVEAEIVNATVNGTLYHRVMIKHLDSLQEAQDLGRQLERELGVTYLIRKE